MAERTHGIRSILSLPAAYQGLQNLLSMEQSRTELVERYIRPFAGMRVLDVGCGPANILTYLPNNIQYTGIDLSVDYIEKARLKFQHRGEFHALALNEVEIEKFGEFDLVLGTGLLHHLDDSEGSKFFKDAHRCLPNGGRTLTVDPVFVPEQHWFARFMAKMDRGLNVRTPEQYIDLTKGVFDTVEHEVRHDRLKIPYSHMMLECMK